LAIRYILWLFGIFSRFGKLYQQKSGNPGQKVVLPTRSQNLFISGRNIKNNMAVWDDLLSKKGMAVFDL
jgi:hypothetical protein